MFLAVFSLHSQTATLPQVIASYYNLMVSQLLALKLSSFKYRYLN